jgi:arginyl-tRNA synthetase
MVKEYKRIWTERIIAAINELCAQDGIDASLDPGVLSAEIPPSLELGDLAFPMFPFAKVLRAAPPVIAGRVREALGEAAAGGTGDGRVSAAGPYLNIFLPRPQYTSHVVSAAVTAAERFGSNASRARARIMIEFSSPNTNKPLHLGHMRNDALGESVARILKACGADVRAVNLLNDRGIHICKSMLAYQKFGNGVTPEQLGQKSDHFVGDYYVRFAEWAREDPSAETLAQEMLRKWEAGDEEVVALWKQMREWVVDGIFQTYTATGVSFDQVYSESETYRSGRDEILKGVERGVFYRDEDGSVWVDLSDIKLDKKALLRADGTSLYVTQDVGTVIARHRDWPFESMIYVVASEQEYHFRVLFHVLAKLGFPWAPHCYHLSYGMVNLPEGKMKSREGTVVDADDLIASLSELAAEEIRTKEREGAVEDLAGTSHAVAVAALHYYLLQVSPRKDMIFDPKESLSFNGNTGPYLQYMCARIESMLRKAADAGVAVWSGETGASEPDWGLLSEAPEWELAKLIGAFPETVERAGAGYDPSLVAGYVYEVAKNFSRYYHDHPILAADDAALRAARLALSRAVLTVLRNALELLNIPYLSVM